MIVSGANLAYSPADIQLPADAGFLVLQNELSDAANLELARKARAAGLLTILNAAPARPLSPDLTAEIDILVVNRIEASALAGLAIDSQATATEAARQRSKLRATLDHDGRTLPVYCARFQVTRASCRVETGSR